MLSLRERLRLIEDIERLAIATDKASPEARAAAERLVAAGYAPTVSDALARAKREYEEEMARERAKRGGV
jgi:hypothetical protein